MRLIKMYIKFILIGCLTLSFGNAYGQPSTVDYGMVTNVEKVEISDDNKKTRNIGTAVGGLTGGVIGYGLGKGSTRGKTRRSIVAGGAGGALLGRYITRDAGKVQAYGYTVKLNSGESVDITTEQGRIDVGDCVTIERGESVNIRRVSQIHCQDKDSQASEKHVAEAIECEKAKAAMLEAETDEALAAAVRKARLICED